MGLIGRSMLRAIIESAYNILPSDTSEEANLGVDVDSTGAHPSRNKIINIITPESSQYKTITGQSTSVPNTNSNDLPEWLNQ